MWHQYKHICDNSLSFEYRLTFTNFTEYQPDDRYLR
jgi:hypothetical protein